MRFCVLASGSSGNSSLLVEGSYGVLLDLGLGPRTLLQRLEDIGASWDHVQAALLTHVHGDHWNENTLRQLCRLKIPLHCHPSHVTELEYQSAAFANLLDNDLINLYQVSETFMPGEGIRCLPLELPHDAGVTCGFRFEGGPSYLGQTWALGYAADLGSWDQTLADAFANVDVLALEFNHDEILEKQSGRGRYLIQRVLGDHGHLSNNQAAALVHEVLTRSASNRLRHLVQLHLSRQCNRPDLARMAIDESIPETDRVFQLHTAQQNSPSPILDLRQISRRKRRGKNKSELSLQQPWLPGW